MNVYYFLLNKRDQVSLESFFLTKRCYMNWRQYLYTSYIRYLKTDFKLEVNRDVKKLHNFILEFRIYFELRSKKQTIMAPLIMILSIYYFIYFRYLEITNLL